MSERGSFVTQFCYCDICVRALESALASRCKNVTVIRGSIVAGYVSGGGPGDEIIDFNDCADAIAAVICHPVRIAVIAEQGEALFRIQPNRPPFEGARFSISLARKDE